MSTQVVCIPVTENGAVDHSWGKAHTVAIMTVEDGSVTSWRTEAVRWDLSKAQVPEGTHHATVARFVKDHAVTHVAARHMGDPMENMLTKLGVRVYQGIDGDARAVAESLESSN